MAAGAFGATPEPLWYPSEAGKGGRKIESLQGFGRGESERLCRAFRGTPRAPQMAAGAFGCLVSWKAGKSRRLAVPGYVRRENCREFSGLGHGRPSRASQNNTDELDSVERRPSILLAGRGVHSIRDAPLK
jgi:hypothetical protein